VEVNTDNSGGKLLPYLTANVKFIVGERHNVLMVPNAALRWVPLTDQIVPEFRTTDAEGKGAESPSPVNPTAAKKEQSRGVIWVPQGSLVRPIMVQRGLSDGSLTEVASAELKEGIPVVVGEAEKEAGKGEPGGSPFTPQLFRRSTNSR
jgi:HlyD family secretion protein